MNLSELDELVAAAGMAVRPETLGEAWELTGAGRPTPLPAGQVLVLIVLRARPGMERMLEAASREFVQASLVSGGALSSTLHNSGADPRTWFLVERFAGEGAFGRHMASDYFRTFQSRQETLLAEPVRAIFLASAR